MQTDPFAAGAEPVDDPFATTPAAPATPQATPPAPDTPATTGNTGAVTGDVPDGGTVETGDSGSGTPAEQPPAESVPEPVPVVNREGEAVEVQPEPGHTAPSQADVAEVAPGPLDTTPEDQGIDPAATDDPQPPEPGAVPAQAPEQSAAQQPAEQPQAPAEAPAQPEAAPEPQAAPQASPAPAQQAAEGDGNGDAKKAKQMRHYVVLMQTGPDQFTKLDLRGKDYTKEIEEEDGTKAIYLEARNNDHAYKLAYHLVGSPRDGATLLPLPKASWRPRRVAPAPPQPERERLVIQ
jgi:hypothetical protein